MTTQKFSNFASQPWELPALQSFDLVFDKTPGSLNKKFYEDSTQIKSYIGHESCLFYDLSKSLAISMENPGPDPRCAKLSDC